MAERRKSAYLYLLPAVCTAAALSLDMGSPRYQGYPEIAWNVLFSLSQRPFLPLCAAAWFLYRALDRRAGQTGRERRWASLLLWNAFTALIWLLAEGLRLDGTGKILLSTAGQRLKSVLYFAGITCGLQGVSAWLYALLTRPDAPGSPPAVSGGCAAADAVPEEAPGNASEPAPQEDTETPEETAETAPQEDTETPEEIPEAVPEEALKEAAEAEAREKTETVPEDPPEETAETAPQAEAETPEETPEAVPEEALKEAAEAEAREKTETVPEETPEEPPETTPQDEAETVQEKTKSPFGLSLFRRGLNRVRHMAQAAWAFAGRVLPVSEPSGAVAGRVRAFAERVRASAGHLRVFAESVRRFAGRVRRIAASARRFAVSAWHRMKSVPGRLKQAGLFVLSALRRLWHGVQRVYGWLRRIGSGCVRGIRRVCGWLRRMGSGCVRGIRRVCGWLRRMGSGCVRGIRRVCGWLRRMGNGCVRSVRRVCGWLRRMGNGCVRSVRRVCGWLRRIGDWCVRGVRWCLRGVCLVLQGVCGGVRWFWNRCPFLASFLSLLLLWSPHLLLSYPASLTPSAWNQLEQYFGLRPWTNFHPPASTLLLGRVVEWGTELGRQYGLDAPGNLGLFLYAVFQALCFAAVLAYVFRLMHTLRSPLWLRWTAFLCCVLVPFYTSYLSTLLKDNLYSYCFLLMSAELSVLALRGRSCLTDWRHVPLWWLSLSGVILLRHNGKYIAWPLVLLLALLCIRAAVRSPKKEWLRSAAALAVLLLPVLGAGRASDALAEEYRIEPGSVREAFSLPFQQTARYVKYYGGDVTEEEREILDAVLDYANLAKNYNPRLADPVKDSYREEAEGEDLAAYFRVWFQQFLRHPDAYFMATVHQNYYLLYPFVPNESVFTGLDEKGRNAVMEALEIRPVPELKSTQFDLNHFYRACFWIPGVGLASHLAAYTLLFVWLALFALRRRLYRWLLPAFPVFLSLGVSAAAPVIQGHPRYAFPVVYAVPLLTALWIALYRRSVERSAEA